MVDRISSASGDSCKRDRAMRIPSVALQLLNNSYIELQRFVREGVDYHIINKKLLA